MRAFLEIFSQIRVTGGLDVHFWDGLLVRSKFACKQHMILKQKLAMMASVELGHLLLNTGHNGQASPFLHHLNHVLVLQPGRDVRPILHELPKTDILNRIQATLWQTKE